MGTALIGTLVAPASMAAVNTPPVPGMDIVTVEEDSGTYSGNLLANDTDADGDDLAVTAIGILSGSIGVLTVTSPADGDFTFTPAAGYNGGPTDLAYTVSDGYAAVAGTIRITVTPQNDPPVAQDKDASTTEDTELELSEATLLAGATDPEGDDLTVSAVGNAEGGSVDWASGVATFTPTANLCGTDAGGFDFTVSDGHDGTDTARVTIDITCVEDVPVADDQAVDVVFDQPASITLTGSDGDGDDLEFIVVADPARGDLSGTGAALTYTPDAGFTGEDAFTFRVNDGDEDSEIATVSITVAADETAPVPAAPTVAFGTGRVNERAPLLVSWSATDAGVGVESYEVQVRLGAGSWTTIYTGSDTSITASYPFKTSLQWRMRATDANDNQSDWALSAVRKLRAYQGGSPAVAIGTWFKVKAAAASGTGYRDATALGNKFKLTFTGLGVIYVAPKVANGGYARVKISGVVTRVRLRAGSTTHGQIMASRMWGTAGTHTIKVINDRGGRPTTFDAFVVLK